MNAPKLLLYLAAAFFMVYGVLFVLLPYELAAFVVGAEPATTSAAIDMRATYGGMTAAFGVFLFMLGRSTLRWGLTGLLLIMCGMALGRIWGIVVDQDPNAFMLIYLCLEIAVAGLCAYFLRHAGSET